MCITGGRGGWLSQWVRTASMNLGYCYLRGHGVPADKVEALRLFRLAVEQGEPQAAVELERLGEPVEDSKVKMHRRIRYVDETVPGKHVGFVGIDPPADADASTSGDTEERR